MPNLAATDPSRQSLSISGMTCSGCARTIERVLSRVQGVSRVTVDLSAGRALIEGGASPAELIAAAEAAGYGAESVADGSPAEGQANERRTGCC